MPKKICFIGLNNLPVLAREFKDHGIGGEEVQHGLLAKALVARGYDVSMIVIDLGQADAAVWSGITVYKTYRPSDGWPVLRFLYPRLTGMWSALKRADADIYYISCASFRVGICALFAKLHRRKLVFRIASDMDCEPDKLLLEYNYWRDKQIYEYGLRRADVILAQSVKQKAAMSRNYALESHLAAMMVDSPQARLGFVERSADVLWVSNIRQLKRPDLLLALARSAPELQMNMVGGEMAESVELFRQIKMESTAIENLTFHGQIPYQDVNEFFAQTRVFVNTSDIEGFPNSYLQAWIRGTPVIAFFDPDDLIAREGLGVAVKDTAEMIAAVRKLCSDQAAWEAASRRCIAFMAREFDENKILDPYIRAIGSP